MIKTIIATLLVLIVADSTQAGLFGRRRRSSSSQQVVVLEDTNVVAPQVFQDQVVSSVDQNGNPLILPQVISGAATSFSAIVQTPLPVIDSQPVQQFASTGVLPPPVAYPQYQRTQQSQSQPRFTPRSAQVETPRPQTTDPVFDLLDGRRDPLPASEASPRQSNDVAELFELLD